jgi:Ca2+-binding EF-hand superfamily protein
MEELLSIPLKGILLMIKLMKTNKDGEIDYTEFINMILGD